MKSLRWAGIALMSSALACAPRAQTTRADSGVHRDSVPRMAVAAIAPSTVTGTPSEFRLPEPTLSFASTSAACAAVDTIVKRVARSAAGRPQPVRADTEFTYWNARATTMTTCRWVMDGHAQDASAPMEDIAGALHNAGWVDAPEGYSADGPDGSDEGLVTKETLCLVVGSWDGGDDSDTTYVPSDEYRVDVSCVPRRADDRLK